MLNMQETKAKMQKWIEKAMQKLTLANKSQIQFG